MEDDTQEERQTSCGTQPSMGTKGNNRTVVLSGTTSRCRNLKVMINNPVVRLQITFMVLLLKAGHIKTLFPIIHKCP